MKRFIVLILSSFIIFSGCNQPTTGDSEVTTMEASFDGNSIIFYNNSNTIITLNGLEDVINPSSAINFGTGTLVDSGVIDYTWIITLAVPIINPSITFNASIVSYAYSASGNHSATSSLSISTSPDFTNSWTILDQKTETNNIFPGMNGVDAGENVNELYTPSVTVRKIKIAARCYTSGEDVSYRGIILNKILAQ